MYLADAEVGSHGKFLFLHGKKSSLLKIQLPDLTHADVCTGGEVGGGQAGNFSEKKT